MNTMRQSRNMRQQGASLIEVLVAMLLVALGILAMGALQLNGTRLTKSSESRAMGAMLVSDLADRMRANRPGVFFRATPASIPTNLYQFSNAYPADGAIDIPEAPTNCVDADCSETDMAQYDMASWRRAVASALPGGWARVGEVDTADAGVDIWLMWVDVDGTFAGESTACPADAVAAPVGDIEPAVAADQLRCMYFRVNL